MTEKAIKISCTSTILKPESSDGVIWRQWRLQINPIQHASLSSYIDHVEYFLHESFETPHIVCYKEPFVVQQVGWGAFDLKVIFHFRDVVETPSQKFLFDLNFEKPKYSEYYTLRLLKSPTCSKESYKSMNITKRKREASISSTESSNDKSPKTRRVAESPEFMTSCTLDDRCRSPRSCNTFTRKQQAGSVTQSAWKDASSQIDIEELSDSLEALDDDNLRKIYYIFFEYDQRNMSIVETEDEYFIDLYSLDPSLLIRLWEFTRNVERKRDCINTPH